MYKFRYQIKRLNNMRLEWLRLVQLFTRPQTRGHRWHLLSDWSMNGTVWDPAKGKMGRDYRIAETFDPSDKYKVGRSMRDADGNEIRIKRDIYDQVVDTIWDVISLFWRNIFVYEACTHPHQKVWIAWEGDREYGYVKQHRCGACGTYISHDDIDQYLPPEDRHPELIEGDPVNPMDRNETGRFY